MGPFVEGGSNLKKTLFCLELESFLAGGLRRAPFAFTPLRLSTEWMVQP